MSPALSGRLFPKLIGACSILFLVAATSVAPRPPWTANRLLGSPNPPAPFTVQRLFPKLAFNHPVDLALVPGSERWFLLEQGGSLYSFPNRSDVDRAELVFDFSKGHQSFESAYATAFHPRFAENGMVFICYVVAGDWSDDPPDDRFKTGQDINDLQASILRLDVDQAAGTNAYAVPADNPFVKTPGARPEVYAFGLRNPWRMSFDRATGDLWVGDVGWEQREMIHRVKAGGNYGWSLTEGPNTRVRTDVRPGPGPILPPLIALPHSEAASITGGPIYHGKKLGSLRGAYLYGDWETGKFWPLRNRGDELLSNDELCRTTLKPVSFAEDLDGELLILDCNGGLYTFVANPVGGERTWPFRVV